MIAVFWKRGCWRIMSAISKPSISGMLTSIRTTRDVGLQQLIQRLPPRRRLDKVLPKVRQDRLVGEEFGRLVIHHQDVDLLRYRSFTCTILSSNSYPCSFSDVTTSAKPRATARCLPVWPGTRKRQLQALLAVALHGLRRQGNDRQPPQ